MGWAARGEREGSEDEGMSGKWGGQQEEREGGKDKGRARNSWS